MELISICVLCILLPLVVAVVLTFSTRRRRTISADTALLPPGPGHECGWSLLGNFAQLGKLPHVSLGILAKHYGPIMYLKLGQIPCVVVSSADMVRACYRDNDQVCAGRPEYAYGKYLMYGCKGIGFAQYGPRWAFMRKVCVAQMFSAKKFVCFSEARALETSLMIHSIWVAFQKQEEVSISHKVFCMAANNISHMVMGRRIVNWTSAPTAEAEEFKRMINDFFWLVGVFNVGDYIPLLRWLDLQGYQRKMRRLHKKLDSFWERTIREHQGLDCKPGEHFLDVLLSLTSSTTPEPDKLNINEVKAAMMDLFAAGTDTTAVAVEWAMTELIRNPEVLKKAQDELDLVVGKNSMPKESHMEQLKYLQAVVKEALRLHPPSPLLGARQFLESCKIAGYVIPKGSRLVVNEWLLGRDPSVWDRPLDFLPERFLLHDAPDVRGHDFEFIPFGGGRRICMGMPLALCNLHLALASLVHCFDWSLPAPHQTLDMNETFGTALPKAVPLLLTPVPRLPQELYIVPT